MTNKERVNEMIEDLESMKKKKHSYIIEFLEILGYTKEDIEFDDDASSQSACLWGNSCESDERIDNIIKMFRKLAV